jgi:phosphoribosylaminoimidazole-succinocarboxamide synthase
MSHIIGNRIKLYEGSTRTIYAGVDDSTLIMYFKSVDEDESLCTQRNRISASIWTYLKSVGIKNHFIKSLNVREQLISAVNVSQVFVRVHNIAQSDMTKRLGVETGTIFSSPLIEWHLKSMYLKDPLISRDHIEYFRWLDEKSIKAIRKAVIRTNDVLRALFYYAKLKPSVIEMHFGIVDSVDPDEAVVLVGEMSPKTIQFWDDSNDTEMAQHIAYERIQIVPKSMPML